MPQISAISATEFGVLDPRRIMIVDVRSPMEYSDLRLARAHVFMPLDSLEPEEFALRHGIGKDMHICLLCASGQRAARAAEQFAAQGFSRIQVVTGGLAACRSAGLALTGPGAEGGSACQDAAPLSLERQVRIAAGSLVVIGAVLGLAVNSWFILLALLVGSGLVWAGVTNWCGMALLLTKAPWNKGSCAIGAKNGPAKPGASCQ